MSDLSNDDIIEVLNAENADPEFLAQLMELADVEASGNAADDVRALAELFGVEPDSILYGVLSEDSPLFNQREE